MKVVAWLLGFVCLVLVIAFSYTQEIRNYIFRDQVVVRPKGILIKSIQIKRVGEQGSDTIVVFKDGEQQRLKASEPGLNRFIVFVDNQKRAQFEQFVSSPISKHDYVYQLHRQQDSIFVGLQIFGPDQAR
ncbi:hypothetical protein [Fulvivirga lutimaris]|uniref:hypothetical protein n=1 Tax=Fulvivirga lutimaris TaxID=1819566 RepID=UPI0012BC198B|nr:hypothetical protein [Fulvivirga lutimaris]MTI40113.1 hypothetical protein [Fulvivirga lutimaris]